MGESAMKFKVKRASWWGYNLWKSKAFGYFDHTGMWGHIPVLPDNVSARRD
jgi:hypothetical protein